MGDGRLRRREVAAHGGSTVPRNVTGRRKASEYSQKKQFFPFLSLNSRVILKKASSFCINFLLLCVLCVYFAPYTLKKSHPFMRLSVNIL